MNTTDIINKITDMQNQLNELMKYVKSQNSENTNEDKVGFADDKVFLLSKNEYEKYKSIIPLIADEWWLRDCWEDDYGISNSYVDIDGDVYDCGTILCLGIRPAIKDDIFKEVGHYYSWNNAPVYCIDKGLAISARIVDYFCFEDYEIPQIYNYEHTPLRERVRKMKDFNSIYGID